MEGIELAADAYAAVAQADAAVVLTEWPEFRTLDWPRIAAVMGTPRVIDTRNLLDRDVLTRAGLTWTGVGRRQASDATVLAAQ
nr:UDP binding domain-containing protein [Rhodococcus qingshengii]